MLARGNINAAQIIKEGDRYFSHEQKLENIEAKGEALIDFRASKLILYWVFRDYDHEIDFDHQDKTSSHNNVAMPEAEDRYAIFDFDKAFRFPQNRQNTELGEWPKPFLYMVKSNIDTYRKVDDEGGDRKLAERLIQKAESFLATTLKDQATFNTILEKSEVDLVSDDFVPYFGLHSSKNKEQRAEVMFNQMKGNLQLIKQASEEYLAGI